MKRIQKWSALLMAVTLLFTLAAPAALAAESTVTIKTAEDFGRIVPELHAGYLVPGQDRDPEERS